MSDSVFISYASPDFRKAQEICEFLAASGMHCWIAPDSILPGERYPVAISNAIRSCSTFLLVFSRSSDVSDAVMNEIELATRHKKRVVPVRIEDAEPGNLAYYVGASQWVDYFKPGAKDRLRSIIRISAVEVSQTAGPSPSIPKWSLPQTPAARWQSKQQLTMFRLVASVAVGYGSFFCIFHPLPSYPLPSYLVGQIVGPIFGIVVVLWHSPLKAILSRRNGLFLVLSTLIWAAVYFIGPKGFGNDSLVRVAVLIGSVLLPFAQALVLNASWRRATIAVPLTYGAFEVSSLIVNEFSKRGWGSFEWLVNCVTCWQLIYLLCMFARPSSSTKVVHG